MFNLVFKDILSVSYLFAAESFSQLVLAALKVLGKGRSLGMGHTSLLSMLYNVWELKELSWKLMRLSLSLLKQMLLVLIMPHFAFQKAFFTPFTFLCSVPLASWMLYIFGHVSTNSAISRPAHSSFIFPVLSCSWCCEGDCLVVNQTCRDPVCISVYRCTRLVL